jgi:hypothetical protein
MSDERRRQRRVEAAIPVEVRGTDAQGAAFEDFAEAVDVSRRGLSILTKRDIPMFANLTVTIPGRGPHRPGEGPSDFFAEATVVRVAREGDLNRLGIRFVGATLPMYTAETE